MLTREQRRVSAPRVVNIDDLRLVAQRRLPKVIFEYMDGGAEGEVTLRNNRLAFEEVYFRPRSAIAVPRRDLRTRVLGADMAMPFLLAPIGFSRLMYPRGEVHAARVAGNSGVGYVLSTMSGCALEDVAAATTGPRWYQLYLAGGRAAAEPAIERVRKAGYTVLAITIDTGTFGMRERDVRNGTGALLGTNMFAKLPFLPQLLANPGWLAGFLRDGSPTSLPNIAPDGRGPMPLALAHAALAGSVVTWSDLDWIRKIWTGPIVVKGVQTGDDARRSLDHGAAAVVVSNHGGRQLDGVCASLRTLPEVLDAVNGRADVLVDGGIRRGSDIIKAISMGARAVLIGRAYAYGLGAAGEAGVARAIEILRADMERTLALLGCESVAELDPSYVEVPASWKPTRT
jgi:isopentenyl diphosphate isomerase/L-lactate dehydrogenase-like FMN-dependent dehydrogenase